jgi:hypothetical protein
MWCSLILTYLHISPNRRRNTGPVLDHFVKTFLTNMMNFLTQPPAPTDFSDHEL